MSDANIELLEDSFKALKLSLKEDLKEVQVVEIGRPQTALAEVTAARSSCYIGYDTGSFEAKGIGDCYTYTASISLRFYWLLTPRNSELVELSICRMAMQLSGIYRPKALNDARGLTSKASFHLIPTREFQRASFSNNSGYEEVGGKIHRVLVQPAVIEVTMVTS